MTLPKLAPGDRVEMFEVTDAMRERISKICGDLADWLMAHTSGPSEAFICLDFVADSMRHQYGLKAVGVHTAPEGGEA